MNRSTQTNSIYIRAMNIKVKCVQLTLSLKKHINDTHVQKRMHPKCTINSQKIIFNMIFKS